MRLAPAEPAVASPSSTPVFTLLITAVWPSVLARIMFGVAEFTPFGLSEPLKSMAILDGVLLPVIERLLVWNCTSELRKSIPVVVMLVRFVAPVAVKLPPVLVPNCNPVGAPFTVTVPAVTAALELVRTRPVVAALVTLTFPRFTGPVIAFRLMASLPGALIVVVPVTAKLPVSLFRLRPIPAALVTARFASVMLAALPVTENAAAPGAFDWPLCYEAEKLIGGWIEKFLRRNAFAHRLAERMPAT